MRVLVYPMGAFDGTPLAAALAERSFEVETSNDPREANEMVANRRYRLLLVHGTSMSDLALELCRQIRSSDERIAIVVATRDGSREYLRRAFDAGVDEYLNHDCDEDEILTRIAAMIRRIDARYSAKLRAGSILVDEQDHQAFLGTSPLDLTLREFSLLRYLVTRMGDVVTREDIRSKVWHAMEAAESNVIEVHIGRLRQKLGAAATQLRTIRGTGYCLLPEPPEPHLSRTFRGATALSAGLS